MGIRMQKPLTIYVLRRGVAASRSTARRLGSCAAIGGIVALVGFAIAPFARIPLAVPSILAGLSAIVWCFAARYVFPVYVARKAGWARLFSAMQRAEGKRHEHV